MTVKPYSDDITATAAVQLIHEAGSGHYIHTCCS